jgi:isoleucyl-tRNA synthetase
VFLTTWHELPEVPASKIDWHALIELRGDVLRELEKLRVAGTIGAPLEAEVDVYCIPAELPHFSAIGDELRFLFITSAARVHKVDSAPHGDDYVACTHGGVWIRVTRTDAPKCVRCWHRRKDVGSSAEHPELCARCVENITGPGENRQFA